MIVSGKVDLQNAAMISGAFDFLIKGDDTILQLGKILENIEIGNDRNYQNSKSFSNALIWTFFIGVSCLGVLSTVL